MATLRLLFSLSIVVLGSVLAGLAMSGYYEPRIAPARDQAAVPMLGAPEPAQLQRAVLPSRLRFVARVDETPPPPPMKPKPASRKAPVKERPEVKPGRPRQVAAPGPWSLFGN